MNGDITTPKRKRSRWDIKEPIEATQAVPEVDGLSRPSDKNQVDESRPRRKTRWDQAHHPESHSFSSNFRITNQEPILKQLTDAELDRLLPIEGYKIYNYDKTTLNTLSKEDTEGDDQISLSIPYEIPSSVANVKSENHANLGQELPADLAFLKPEDLKYFQKVLGEGESSISDTQKTSKSSAETKELRILKLILRVKNGLPPVRKAAMRQLTDNARSFGARPLFDCILPLLMSQSIDDQERHLLVKIIDRILYKLDDLVRPYVHKILVVMEPMLIDSSYFVRLEAREIISNLSKAAGLAIMISVLRPDVDHEDELVRETTSKTFAVVASALGIHSILQFLSAVCRSKKSWKARQTGVKIVQQISHLMGCSVLPYLEMLVECVSQNLNDEQPKVRMATLMAISELASASTPYGIECFTSILPDLTSSLLQSRGRQLSLVLRACTNLVPLMEVEQANLFSRHLIRTIQREFSTPNDDMKRTIFLVINKISNSSIEFDLDFIKLFLSNFVTRQNSIDKRLSKMVADTIVTLTTNNSEIINTIISTLCPHMRDENESFRRVSIEAISRSLSVDSVSRLNDDLIPQLVDFSLYTFQEQTNTDDMTVLNSFTSIINSLAFRSYTYLPQIVSTILWRLNNKSAKVRQQAADLTARLAQLIHMSDQNSDLLSKLGLVLYERLGEEYPEVLASILAALKAIIAVLGISLIKPPISDLLPRLTPILRNRHEKVQENTIDLVGRIADRAPEKISAREWMRIAFELLDMLNAYKKGIKRAAVNTFGYIAKAIGPQDVLALLLNNLKVQERQNRVCTTVAIAIVAETCAPFTVVPALMADYLTPELNVQNGVLKSFSFIFEYIGDSARDYVYTVTPLLEDALTDRDQVHRQTASTVVKHMALATVGMGVEDAMMHLLNLVWPNILEESPHVINAVREAVDALRVNLGSGIILNYLLCGLFHPSRKVRNNYWTIYNSAYVQHADSMVPYYPQISNDLHIFL